MTSMLSTQSSRRTLLKLTGVAAALGAVCVTVIVGTAVANRPPDGWPRKAEFCEEAAALEVGSIGLSRTEHMAVLERLGEYAPDELVETFDEIVHANEQLDRSMVNEDQMHEVGEFIEKTCGINMPGATS